MLKKELAKLLEALKDDDNVDEILGGTEPVKALVSSGLTLDAFKAKLENDPNFKSFMDSEKDKHSKKAFETWKQNNLQKLLDDEIKKRYPDKDPKDKALEDLKIEMEKMKAENLKKDLTNNTLKVMTEKKLPTGLVNLIVGADEDSTNKNLETLEKIFADHDEAIKTEILKDGTYKPGGQGGTKPTEEAVKGQINSVFGIKE